MSDIRADGDDWPDVDPLSVIISTKYYIVFIDKDEDVDWATKPEYDETQPNHPAFNLQRHNSILNSEALLEATPCGNFDRATKLNFKRLLGEAFARSFDYDYDGAEKMLVSAEQYIRARSEETSRFWYLSASFLTAGVFLAAGAAVWIYRVSVALVLSSSGTSLALATVAGAMGALLSVIWRTGSLKFDASAGRTLHYLEAFSRICAGALSGFLVGLAVQCGIILNAFSQDGRLQGIMILAGLAAGTSERMASSIISKFDSSEAKSERSDEPSRPRRSS